MPQGFRFHKVTIENAIKHMNNGYEVYADEAKTPWKLIDQQSHYLDESTGHWLEGVPSMTSQMYIKLAHHFEDQVNSPKHYHAGPFEVIKVLKAWNINDFHLGNVIKYVARCGSKHDEPLEDLKKAQWYLNDKIKELENKCTTP